MTIRAALLAVGLSLALPACAPALERAAASPARVDARAIDVVVDRAIAENRLVGASVVVLQDGQPVYERHAGLADREGGRRTRADTLYRLASTSKAITSIAAMRLVETGVVDLDAPVSRWLPGFRPALSDGSRPDISLRQLLSHTSGLSYGLVQPPEGSYRQAGVSDGLDTDPVSLAENMRRLASAPLESAPGAVFRYSLGIDVAGAVVAAAAQAPLPDAVARLVLTPAGARDTAFHALDPARLSAAYWGEGRPVPTLMPDAFVTGSTRWGPGRALMRDAWPSGGAGMVGTAGDVARVLDLLHGRSRLLSRATVDSMFRPVVGPEVRAQGPGWGFGLGGAVLVDRTAAGVEQAAGTMQWGGAYGSNWFVDPVNGLTMVALTNTAPEGTGGRFAVELRDAVGRAFNRRD